MDLLLVFIKRTHKKNYLKKIYNRTLFQALYKGPVSFKRYLNIHHMNFLLSPFEVSIKYPYELSNSYYGIK